MVLSFMFLKQPRSYLNGASISSLNWGWGVAFLLLHGIMANGGNKKFWISKMDGEGGMIGRYTNKLRVLKNDQNITFVHIYFYAWSAIIKCLIMI